MNTKFKQALVSILQKALPKVRLLKDGNIHVFNHSSRAKQRLTVFNVLEDLSALSDLILKRQVAFMTHSFSLFLLPLVERTAEV